MGSRPRVLPHLDHQHHGHFAGEEGLSRQDSWAQGVGGAWLTSFPPSAFIPPQRFEKHFHSSEKTDLILLALQGMRDCSNYNTQVASTLMAVLTVDFNPMPNDVSNRELLARGLSPWEEGVGLGWVGS